MVEKKHIKAILFDLDGTIINSKISDTTSFQSIINENLGISISDNQMKGFFGTPTKTLLSKFVVESEIETLYQHWLIEKEKNSGLVQIFPGVLDSIQHVRNIGIKTAIVTSQFEAESALTREHFNLTNYFDAWITSDHSKMHKPDPEPVYIALEKLGVNPDHAIMVGDTLNDIDAGKSAGTLTAAALWGAGDEGTLIQRNPDYLLYATGDIITLVE